MIDVEFEVFTKVATALRAAYSGIYVAGEYVNQPSKFPAVFILEMANTVRESTIDSGSSENHADLMYQVDVYSNLVKGKKAEAKEIMAAVDEQFARLGFIRTFCNPVPNFDDARIYRMTARYVAVAGKDNYIYRR